MRYLPFLAFATFAGCSSTQSTGTVPEPRPTTITSQSGSSVTIRTSVSDVNKVDTLWVNHARVWKVLPAVYGIMDIPIANYDAEKGIVGNAGLKLFRRLGKVPLTRYLDCGSTQVGPNVESYEVMLSVLTIANPVPGDTSLTVVHTSVDASARPMQFAGAHTQCRSKGALEAQLLQTLKVQLAP